MTDILPYEIERRADGADFVSTVASLPNSAAYPAIDHYDMTMAKGGAARTGSREDFELQAHYLRWRVSGRNAFVIGPETMARILDRVKRGDVPTAPVPPVFISFEEAPCNYAASRPLRGAFLSRGVVGRISMLAAVASPSWRADPSMLTVLLPSGFSDRHLDHLKRGLSAAKRRPAPAAASSLARTMAGNIGDLDEEAIDLLAGHLGSIGSSMEEDPEPAIDLSAALVDRAYGPLPGKPNPLLPKAARIVLVAADEARQADEAYGRPTYLDGNQIERNWMENADQPVDLREDVVRLP